MIENVRKLFNITDENKVAWKGGLVGRGEEIEHTVVTHWVSMNPRNREDQAYYRRYESDWSNPE